MFSTVSAAYGTQYPPAWGSGYGTAGAYTIQFGDGTSSPIPWTDGPLVDRGLISGTYRGEMFGGGGGGASSGEDLSRFVSTFREHGSEDLCGPRSSAVSVRLWNNGFHRQLSRGQAIFCIDDPDIAAAGGDLVSYDMGPSSATHSIFSQSVNMDPATIVTPPQLVCLFERAKETVQQYITSRSAAMSAFSGRKSATTPAAAATAAAETSKASTPTTMTTALRAEQQRPSPVSARTPRKSVETLDSVVHKKPESEWGKTDSWRTFVGTRDNATARLDDIAYIKRNVRFLGIAGDAELDPAAIARVGLGAGSMLMDVMTSGNVRCRNYWGANARIGCHVGFIIKRPQCPECPKRFHALLPWTDRDSTAPRYIKKPSSSSLPSRSVNDLHYTDFYGNDQTGAFYYVGKITSVDLCPRVAQLCATTPYCRGVPANVDLSSLGLYGGQADLERAVDETKVSRDVVVVDLCRTKKTELLTEY
jgi:hypothetical protein